MTRGITSEMLSAALDGECSSGELDRLLQELERVPRMRLEWSRLCLARDAAAAARVRLGARCICDGVMTAIEREPVPSPRVVAAPRRPLLSWRPMAALAAAASVAGVALISYHNINLSKSDALPVTAALLPVAASGVQTAALSQPATLSAPAAANHPLSNEDMQQLDGYLIDYSNYRAGAGMGDTLGYARFAAHTAEYRADNR